MVMIEKLSPWMQKLLAWTLLGAVLAAVAAVFARFYVEPLAGYMRDQEREIEKRRRVQGILSQEPVINRRMTEFRARTRDVLFLSSGKSTAASSELQNLVKRMIKSQTRSSILSLKPYPVKSLDGYFEVTIEVRVKGLGHEGLKRVLYGMESSRPLLRVRKIDIKRPVLRYKSIVGSSETDNQLGVVIVVSAYFRPDVPDGEDT